MVTAVVSILLLGSCDPEKESKTGAAVVNTKLQSYVDRWLQTDCDFGEEGSLADSVLKWRADLIPLLLDAAVNGPSDSLSAYFLQGVYDMYSGIEQRYAAGDSLLFSQADREAFSKQTLQTFSERRYDAWATAYRSRALIALADLKYEKGEELFEDVLADTALVDLHAAAKQGLERY